jgi:micrococcal nuclease
MTTGRMDRPAHAGARPHGILRILLAGAVALLLAACTGLPVRAPTATGRPAAATPTARPAPAGLDLGLRPTGRTQRGLVTRVTDGDTIRVLIDGQEHRLRYIGIDTPESVHPNRPVEPYALAATAENARLVEGREVILERDVSETDRFGRLLRYVWLEPGEIGVTWRMVNLELLLAGFARVTTYPPDVKYVDLFLAAQREAREAGRGLWADE